MNRKLVFLSLSFVVALKILAADSSTNAVTSTIAEELEPIMVLSQPTNSIKCGVFFSQYNTAFPSTTNKTLVIQNNKLVTIADLVIVNTAKKKFYFHQFWPQTDLACEIAMTDEQGNAVPKTVYGASFGRLPDKSPDNEPSLHRSKFGLNEGGVEAGNFSIWGGQQYNPLKNLPQCFKLEKPGNYKFTLINRIYVTAHRGTNDNWQSYYLKPMTFPPVTVDVRVEK